MTDFQWDYNAFGEYLVGPEMLAMVAKKGEEVKTVAEAIAPFDASDPAPHYKDCFEVEVGIREGVHPRACATIKNTSDHALEVEFGAKNTPRHRTLGKAVGAAK